MFTIPFWVAFACALAASFGVSLYYGRHAIHPRLRPHFGQVLILFLLMALVSFFLAVVIAKMVGTSPAKPRQDLEATAPKVTAGVESGKAVEPVPVTPAAPATPPVEPEGVSKEPLAPVPANP